MAMMLGIVGAIGSTLMSVMQLQQQAAIAEANAKMQRINAQEADKAAGFEVQDTGLAQAGDRGTIEAERGASGVAVTSGSFQYADTGLSQSFIEDQFRLKLAGNQQSEYYRNAARIHDKEKEFARATIGPTIGLGLLDVGKNFIGSAGVTARSPSFLKRRDTVSPRIGLA